MEINFSPNFSGSVKFLTVT